MDPPGGQIVRDHAGEPTGVLLAAPAAGLLYSTLAKAPALQDEQQLGSTRHRTLPPTPPPGVRQAQALVEAVAESEEHRQWRLSRGFAEDHAPVSEIFDSCFVL